MSFAGRYLTTPDQIPDHNEGQHWGSCTLTIDMAGGPYSVKGLNPRQEDNIRQRFSELCVNEAVQPSVKLGVFRADPSDFKRFDFAGGDYTFDLDYRSGEIRFAGLNFMGRFQWADELQAGLWVPSEQDLISTCIFENVFRTLVAYRLLKAGGMLFHSGAVVWEDQARLFFGRSGAGKSTISRLGLDAGFEVLSDDMNALVPEGDGYAVEKLPFAGDLGQTSTAKGKYPVQGIYRLEQDHKNEVTAMRPASALAALIACAPFVNADPHRHDKLVQNLEDLIRKVPVKKFNFSKNKPAWELLD